MAVRQVAGPCFAGNRPKDPQQPVLSAVLLHVLLHEYLAPDYIHPPEKLNQGAIVFLWPLAESCDVSCGRRFLSAVLLHGLLGILRSVARAALPPASLPYLPTGGLSAPSLSTGALMHRPNRFPATVFPPGLNGPPSRASAPRVALRS